MGDLPYFYVYKTKFFAHCYFADYVIIQKLYVFLLCISAIAVFFNKYSCFKNGFIKWWKSLKSFEFSSILTIIQTDRFWLLWFVIYYVLPNGPNTVKIILSTKSVNIIIWVVVVICEAIFRYSKKIQ